MSNVYAMFDMDKNAEKDGFWKEFSNFRIKIARLGGKNTKYNKALVDVGKKYQKQNIKDITDDEQDTISAELIAKAFVTGWEVKDDDGNWVPNTIHSYPSGEVVDFNVDNVINVLTNLPELSKEIENVADNKRFYTKEYQKEVVKN